MDLPKEKEDIQLVSDFFKDRSVFLTGASGFVGMVILETLLRCCPGIASVYILIRPKLNLTPEQRKELVLEKRIFKTLKEKKPEMLEKVHVITGDISRQEFGMNQEDVQRITEKVSVVYHCAADINLMKPIRYMIQQNCSSTKTMIDLCRRMKNFCVLIYTSTSYSNCNHLHLPTKEEIYRVPFHAQTFLDALKMETDDELLKLASLCKPDWPCWYPFSKCLSENILQDMASDLPFAIIRPSVVGPAWKNPTPGYLDENTGFTKLYFSVAESFIKVLYGDPNIKVNIMPVDIIANVHLTAAWSIGTKKVSLPLIVNCTSRGQLHNNWMKGFKIAKRVGQELLPPNYLQSHKKLLMTKNRLLYWIANVYEHYIPGIITDIILQLKGKKPKVFATYYFFHKFLYSIGVMELNSPEFENNNMDYLNGLLHEKDRKILGNDTQNIKLDEYLTSALQERLPCCWKPYQEIMSK